MASITTYRLHPSIYLKPRLILSKSEPEAPEGACASICISSNYIDLFEVALILLAFALFVSSSDLPLDEDPEQEVLGNSTHCDAIQDHVNDDTVDV